MRKNVEAVKFIRSENKNGRLQTIEGSEFTESCDMVIRATGQSKQRGFLGQIDELKLDDKNRIIIDPETYQTKNFKYFAAGDASNMALALVGKRIPEKHDSTKTYPQAKVTPRVRSNHPGT